MVAIVIRCLIMYILLTFSMRIMGKRQIGELDVGDLVSTLLISELAAIPIDDPDIPMLNAVIPILLLISLEIIISTIKNRSRTVKRLVEGNPVYIIYKGRILEEELIKNRISINEVLAEMRGQNIFDISEIKYGIIEQSGRISFFKNSDTTFAHSLIIDGEIIEETVKRVGASGAVEKALKKEGRENILLMSISDSGKINIIRRDKDGG